MMDYENIVSVKSEKHLTKDIKDDQIDDSEANLAQFDDILKNQSICYLLLLEKLKAIPFDEIAKVIVRELLLSNLHNDK